MATIWFYRDNMKTARKYYEKAITVDATYPRAYYGLGLVALQEKNVKKAETRFMDAFEVGSMPEAIYMLGQLYYDTGRKEHALVWFRKYLEKESTSQWAEKARDMIFLLEQELPVDKN
jgi:tetratricopeptide (TPR) repeat protein